MAVRVARAEASRLTLQCVNTGQTKEESHGQAHQSTKRA